MQSKIWRTIWKWIQLDREELHRFCNTNNYVKLPGIVWAEWEERKVKIINSKNIVLRKSKRTRQYYTGWVWRNVKCSTYVLINLLTVSFLKFPMKTKISLRNEALFVAWTLNRPDYEAEILTIPKWRSVSRILSRGLSERMEKSVIKCGIMTLPLSPNIK
jgi:hypothetical protein